MLRLVVRYGAGYKVVQHGCVGQLLPRYGVQGLRHGRHIVLDRKRPLGILFSVRDFFLIFLALHGSIDGAVYKFIHAFSALCGVIFYYLFLPLRDKNVYALNFCAISGGVFFIALIAWHLLLDLLLKI